jgi:hypothetical protein
MVVHFEGEPGAMVKLLPYDHVVMVQAIETATCRNGGKYCIHKPESGRTLPQTLHKRELRAPGCT